jgi:ferredoxin--NADP+ reductase
LVELRQAYDAVVVAIGAPEPRRLGIPGEDLAGSHDAAAFVGWYNGHPEHRDLRPDLSHKEAVVIGNGNVAIDVARLLARNPEELRETSIHLPALAALAASRVSTVHIVGRRGPVQSSITAKELHEIGALKGVQPICRAADFELDPGSEKALAEAKAPAKKAYELLRGFCGADAAVGDRRIVFHFLRSPVELLGTGQVEGIRLCRNRLNAACRAEAIDQGEVLNCGLVVRSIGYRGVPIDGAPFDADRAVIPSHDGRATGEPGLYVAGWIATGPQGLIGAAKKGGGETAKSLLADLPSLVPAPKDPTWIHDVLAQRGVQPIGYPGGEPS